MDLQYPCFVGGSEGGRRGGPNPQLELQRAQLQEYAQRMQLGLRVFPGQLPGVSPLSYHNAHLMSPYFHPYLCKDPRTRFVHEEPKPNHSYIGLIAMAILGSRDRKLVLSDIYQWILDNYSYFRTRGPGWRNSIRHNLSLNDCFVKSGRSANGKGHYWAIHPANFDDFQKGDFRRRRAQRRVRRHMGLSVTDEDDDDSPVPSPVPQRATSTSAVYTSDHDEDKDVNVTQHMISSNSFDTKPPIPVLYRQEGIPTANVNNANTLPTKKRTKRQFDMDSLLAPDTPHIAVDYRLMKKDADDTNDLHNFSVNVAFNGKNLKHTSVGSSIIYDNARQETQEIDSEIEKEEGENEGSIAIDHNDETEGVSTNKDSKCDRDIEKRSYSDTGNDNDDVQNDKSETECTHGGDQNAVDNVSEQGENIVNVSPLKAHSFVYYHPGHYARTVASQQHINEQALQLSKYMTRGMFGVPNVQMPMVVDAMGGIAFR